MSLQVTSPKISPTANAILRAQDLDARCVTLPNMCSASVVEFEDGRFIRCFSVALQRANQLPPDKWEMIALPSKLPQLKITGGHHTDRRHILIDHISLGLIQNNRLQAIVGKDCRLTALKMFPPHDDDDSGEHWNKVATELIEARKQLAIEKE